MTEPVAAEEPPLHGINVVEVAQMIAGPSTGMLLADYGADVIKVEPLSGDTGRLLRSPVAAHLPESPTFGSYNRGKRAIRLDLRSDEGRARLLEIVADADVFIEASRPGAMDRIGFGADDLLAANPRLVYASVSGFGHGELGRRRGGVDIMVQAESGMMSTTGFPDGPPTKVGFTIIDAACGHALSHGIIAALYRRERTGRGDVVRISLYDVALHLQTGPLSEYLMTGVQSPRPGNTAPLSAPADMIRCADGNVIVSAYLESHWQTFVGLIRAPELLDDARFSDGHSRAANRRALVDLLEERMTSETTRHWVEVLGEAGLLVAEIKDYSAVIADPQLAESGAVVSVGDGYGVANPARLERTAAPAMVPRTDLADTSSICFAPRSVPSAMTKPHA